MSDTVKKAPYVMAVIQKDAVEHLPKVVHIFEVPVLQRVHGEQRVTIDESADLPGGLTEATFEPEEEFARLEQCYGLDQDTKQSYVSQAYGGLHGFLETLERSESGAGAAPARKTTARKTKDAASE